MDARALKDKATELFSKGKFAKSAEAYEQYCKADPKDLQARLRMGDAWAKSGKKDRAVVAYQAAAEGFAKDGFLPRAIAASKLVLELEPGHKGVSKMLADLYARKSGASRPTTARTLGAKPDPKPEEPSPTNRADAIEISVEEEPAVAPPPPPPTERTDAIDVPVEFETSDKPKPPPEPLNAGDGIEIELSAGTSGEIEVPIEGVEVGAASGVPQPGELPRELEVAAGIELDPPPPAPPAQVRPKPEPIVDLEEVVTDLPPPPPPPKPEPIIDLEEVAELPPPPGALDPKPIVAASVALDPPKPEPIVAASKPPGSLDPKPEPVVEVASEPSVVVDSSIAEPTPVVLEKTPAEEEIVVLTKKVAPKPEPAAPPGLKKKGDGPAASPPVQPPRAELIPPPASSPSSSRIWLPPSFQAPAAASSSTSPLPPVSAPEPAVSVQTELQRSLEAFTQFDVDVPAAAPPAPAPKAPDFTELELEGDSLLQAVEAAATAASGVFPVSSPSVSLAEEAMEAPDDLKSPEPGALPKIPLFSDLPEDAFIALFERCPLRRAEPGDRIIEQGSQGDSFFVICAGKVRVLKYDGEATRELAIIEEGSFFGEVALLSDAPRSASVEAAAEDTQLLEIPAPVLTELSAQYPTVATALKKFCRQRMLSNLMATAALFRPFTKPQRRDLVQRFRARDAGPGEVLIREGQPSDGLYVVLTGEVSVLVGERQVATLREGQVFGEMSLLTRAPTSATVKTTRKTSFLRLPKQDFDELIMSHPQILEQVAELTDERKKQNAALLQSRPNAMASMV